MNSAWPPLRSKLYSGFAQRNNYTQWSTDAVPTGGTNQLLNIEDVHGIVHNLVGGGNGHMVCKSEVRTIVFRLAPEMSKSISRRDVSWLAMGLKLRGVSAALYEL